MKKVLLICLLASTITAQVDTSLIFGEMEVLGTRLQQRVNESSKDVRILEGEDILRVGARGLDEAIQLLAGIEVQTRGAFGTQADFSIRGTTFNQVLVLLDGQSISDPLTGHFSSNIPVPMEAVKRIEIIRGPSAAIYGPNAVGGVINIITEFSTPHESRSSLTGGYQFGDFGLRRYYVDGAARIRDFRVYAGISDVGADGPEHTEDSTSQFFDIRSMYAGAAWSPSESTRAGVKVSADSRDFDARYYYTRNPFDRSTEKVERLLAQGQFATSWGPHELVYNGSWLSTDDSFLFNPQFGGPNEHTTVVQDHRVEFKTSIGNLQTNLGAQYQWRTIESNDRGDHEEGQFGAFLISQYQFTPSLQLEASMRLDYQEVYDWQWVPHLGLNYTTSQGWRWRALLGRSVRAADYTERFISFGRTSELPGGRNVGNPNLQTESAWTSEVGFSFYGFRNLEIGLTGFYRSSEDLIDYVLTPGRDIERSQLLDPDGEYFYTQNISSLETGGLEFLARYKWRVARKLKGSADVSISYIQSMNEDDVVSKYLANHAGLFVSVVNGWEYEWLRLQLSALYKNRDEETASAIDANLEDEYVLLNGKLNMDLGFGIDVFGQVHNITDVKYSDVLGAPLPGRWWSAGINVMF